MIFTLQELEDIWLTYQSHGMVQDSIVIKKILTEFTYCSLCNHLIKNTEFNQHFNEHK